MERVYALGVRRYGFNDDAGARVEGATLHYIVGDGPDPTDEDVIGELPMQVRVPRSVFQSLAGVELPGYCEIEFRQRPGRGGKPTLTAVDVRAVATITPSAG